MVWGWGFGVGVSVSSDYGICVASGFECGLGLGLQVASVLGIRSGLQARRTAKEMPGGLCSSSHNDVCCTGIICLLVCKAHVRHIQQALCGLSSIRDKLPELAVRPISATRQHLRCRLLLAELCKGGNLQKVYRNHKLSRGQASPKHVKRIPSELLRHVERELRLPDWRNWQEPPQTCVGHGEHHPGCLLRDSI